MKQLLYLSIAIMFTLELGAQNNFTNVDTWLNNNIKDLGGRAVLLIYKNNELVYENELNAISKKQKRRIKFMGRLSKTNTSTLTDNLDTESQMRIASCTKWLTAALAMTFVDEGKLNLNDSIGKYLPIFTKNGKGHIKVWHCLSHLTGISQTDNIGATNDDLEDDNTQKPKTKNKLQKIKAHTNTWVSMAAALDSIAQKPMAGTPGLTFHYGNNGLQIIAGIIEQISGKHFEEIFKQRLAQPLNMVNTNFGNVVTPLAAGGAFSTANDYLNFLIMLLNNGTFNGKTILKPQSVAAILQNKIAPNAQVAYAPNEAGNWGYGFGCWSMDDYKHNHTVNAFSSPGLFGTFPWLDKQKNYCAILFTFNLKSKGRNEKYTELKSLVDNIFQN